MRNGLALLVLAASVAAPSLPLTAAEPAASAELTKPLPVGAALPRLALTSSAGEPFDLNAAIAEKPTVLILYRGGW